MDFKVLIFIAAIIYYIYSSVKSNDAQKNKKSSGNPTPSQKSTIDDILDKMLEQQRRKVEELRSPTPATRVPVSGKLVKSKKAAPAAKPQGMPFEKRKLNDAREMPSRKQIEKVILREKKATEQVVIQVKDYDTNVANHDKPHPSHHLADQSKIRFHFKEDEAEHYDFDARQAIISQIILERRF